MKATFVSTSNILFLYAPLLLALLGNHMVLCLKLTINNPYSVSTWVGGKPAIVEFGAHYSPNELSSTPLLICELMYGKNNGNAQTIQLLGEKINVTQTKIDVPKVNEFPTGSEYFVKLGYSDYYVYSHYFTINGSGKDKIPEIKDNEDSDKEEDKDSSKPTSSNKIGKEKSEIKQSSTSLRTQSDISNESSKDQLLFNKNKPAIDMETDNKKNKTRNSSEKETNKNSHANTPNLYAYPVLALIPVAMSTFYY